ncbi:MAG: shikimate dehydrogenase [Lachnospiraceae bacterium]|nr:shikimate dehydrogenase [Lachnospiraceae bacterium]
MEIMNFAVDGYKDIDAGEYLGIFGNPIKHTMSPVIHDTISRQLGKDMRYIPFHITENLGEAVDMAYRDGIVGLNITVPYKQQVMEHLVDIDEAARVIGAVNTLVRCEDGYKGYNTDMYGLAKFLVSEGVKLDGARVIMLGAGGAARAVAYMCLKYGADRVYIVNRTFENAKKIADDMNKVFDCDKIIPLCVEDYYVIPNGRYIMIQCTSVGLHEGDGLPLISDEAFYDKAEIGVDLIYNPAKTPFLKLVEENGGKAINGLGMLLHQGVKAYELWNGVEVPDWLVKRVYRALCRVAYDNTDNIVLIGYMGSGKSTVGRLLSLGYGYDFIDTDEIIEKREGMSTTDIFAKKGEAYFRQVETELLYELKGKLKNTVVATGGGMPVKEENRQLLKEIGRVFYLKASYDTTYQRVAGGTGRPLLANLEGNSLYNKIKEMTAVRTPIYTEVADEVIDTTEIDEYEVHKLIAATMSSYAEDVE